MSSDETDGGADVFRFGWAGRSDDGAGTAFLKEGAMNGAGCCDAWGVAAWRPPLRMVKCTACRRDAIHGVRPVIDHACLVSDNNIRHPISPQGRGMPRPRCSGEYGGLCVVGRSKRRPYGAERCFRGFPGHRTGCRAALPQWI